MATILPDRPQYVLNTSEFAAVKARLQASENRKKGEESEDNRRPTLKRRTHPDADDKQDADDPANEDRPTLKRRVS
jgi:hypothetical protein